MKKRTGEVWKLFLKRKGVFSTKEELSVFEQSSFCDAVARERKTGSSSYSLHNKSPLLSSFSCRPALFPFFFSLSLFCSASLAAHLPPPPAPGAGVIEREIEKEYEASPLETAPAAPQVVIDIPEERLQVPSGKRVFLDAIVLQGADVLDNAAIVSRLEGDLHRELSLEEIYAICGQIEKIYAEKGYFLARVYPPPQDIDKGVLQLSVLEGKIGSIRVEGEKHYSEAFLLGYFKRLIGKPLRYKEFVRALLLANDNRDLFVSSIFEKGKTVGTADLILRVEDKKPWHLYLNANDYGRPLTTNTRVGGRLDGGNVVTNGDQFSWVEVMGCPPEAMLFSDFVYSLPLNYRGSRLEAAYLTSRFKILKLPSLHLHGTSDIATVKFSQALMRKKGLQSDLFSYFDYKQVENFALHHQSSFDKLRVVTLGASFDYSSARARRDYLVVKGSAGIPNFLDGLSSVDSSCSTPGAGGRFVYLSADFDHFQSLWKELFLHLRASGQFSFYKLPQTEQFYIGGADTVRGFPLASALGDSGYVGSGELSFPPPFLSKKNFFSTQKSWSEVLQFVAFLDYGEVFYHGGSSMSELGTGVGVRIRGPWHLNASFDAGFPLNHRDRFKDLYYYVKITAQPF